MIKGSYLKMRYATSTKFTTVFHAEKQTKKNYPESSPISFSYNTCLKTRYILHR